MSTAVQTTTIESHPQVLKGKYDNRKNNGANLKQFRPTRKRGRKPKALKDLSQWQNNMALRDIDSIANPAKLYALAFERGLLSLCLEIRTRVEDRLLGKPFVAINPDAEAKPSTIINDNRLQVAMQTLLPGAQAKKPRNGKAKQLAAEQASVVTNPPMIEAGSVVESGDPSGQKDTPHC